MGIAAAIMGGSILLSRFMGLFRDKVISYYYGAGLESDIYFASFVIPDFINYLLAGGYFSITLIPLLASSFSSDTDDGWDFFWCVCNWVGSIIIAVTLLAMVCAPWLAQLAAPGFAPEATARLAFFLRIILPAQVFFLLGSCFTALLYLRKQFTVPALTPLVYNGCIILFGLLFKEQGMEGFCWGVLAGSFAGNFLLPLLASRTGDQGTLRYRFIFAHRDFKRFILLALPLMIGQSVVVLDEQLLRVFGSMSVDGAVSWLNYARRIMLVPVGVVAQAAGVASYPFLAQLAASNDTSRFQETLRQAINGATLLVLPLSLWMAVAAEPTIRLIFEQGRFSDSATAQTALCLQIMLLGVAFWGIQQIVGRAFYAHKDTLTPAVCGTIATLALVPLYYFLARVLGAAGIAAASTCAVACYTLALTLVWRKRHGPGAFSGLGKLLLQAAGLCVPACLAARAGIFLLENVLSDYPLLQALLQIMLSGSLFALVFVGLGTRFAPEPLAPAVSLLRRVRRLLGKFET